MPKMLNGKKVSEADWDLAKSQARKQGFTIKKDKGKFYQYAMGILKNIMGESVAGDVAVPNTSEGKVKKRKWSEMVKDLTNSKE